MTEHKCDHNHDHSHSEKHHHGHGHHHHHHAPTSYNKAFIIGISLNFVFVIVEALYGIFSNSLALLSDAGHNLSDVAGLIIAWGAFWLGTRKPSQQYTFGMRKSSILSALLNSIFLMAAVGIIIWEAVHRITSPTPIDTKTVIIVAMIGIVINSLTAMLFFKDKNTDINLKGAYLHMAADALISLGVVISGVIISYTSWFWLDPVISIVIAMIIIYGTWDLLKDSFKLSMDAVPLDVDIQAVKKYLQQIDGVCDVHDLHIWAMSTTENSLTVHLTVNDNHLSNQMISSISKELNEKYKIHHTTIQVELFDQNFECHLKPEDVL